MISLNRVKHMTVPEGKAIQIVTSDNVTVWIKKLVGALLSDGRQVIDTGVFCTDKMSCEIKIAWTEFPVNATYIGAIEYDNGAYYRCHFQVAVLNSDQLIGFWQDSPTLGNAVSIPFDTKPHVLTYSATDMTVGIDGAVATHGNSPTPSNSTFYLFDRNVTGFTANAEAGKCKIYYAKFWENGELIHHFVPKLDGDNKAGLFDIVSKSYYYDKNGNEFSYEVWEEE